MSQPGNDPQYPKPLYQAVSAMRSPSGEVSFRYLRLDTASSKLHTELLGARAAGCEHEHCGLTQLGELALTMAYNLQDEIPGDQQLPLPWGEVGTE